MSTRFYTPDLSLPAADYLLEGPEAHHLRTVCRCRVGDTVELFDGKGRAVAATVINIERKSVYLRLGEAMPAENPAAPLTIAVALPKGDRASLLVEKCTELGVEKLIPLQTRRSVSSPKENKLEKLQRTVVEGCKQCGRNTLMQIAPLAKWDDVCREESPSARRLILEPTGDAVSLPRGKGAAVIAVGPEGGWTEEELELAREQGWKPASLPGHVLRIETAAIAAAAWNVFRTTLGDA